MFSLSLIGHRGLGCTDSDAARIRNQLEDRAPRPAENTLPSLLSPLQEGIADGIETDAILTRDGAVVLTHANDPHEHILAVKPLRPHLIGELALAEVQALRTGVDGNGQIPALADLLDALLPLGASPVLHLELKGTQKTPQPDNAAQLVPAVLQALVARNFPVERLRLSSFSWETLRLARTLAPDIRLGALFDAPAGEPLHGTAGTIIFANKTELYRDFSVATITAAQDLIPHLTAVHPEIRTLTEETVSYCAAHGLAIATWCLREQSPVLNPAFHAAAVTAIELCRTHGVTLALTTDYVAEMRALIGPYNKG